MIRPVSSAYGSYLMPEFHLAKEDSPSEVQKTLRSQRGVVKRLLDGALGN